MSTRDFINTLFPEYKDSESYFQELLIEKIKKLDDEISYYKKKDIENQILLTKMFEDNQKMLENIVDLCENTIKNQKDINKKVSLFFLSYLNLLLQLLFFNIFNFFYFIT